MERIAIVSDIHSNINALEVFMKYTNNECNVSQILNLGDFIQIGPNPLEVYDIIMNDSRFINVLGNSEYMFFDKEIMKRYGKESEHRDWVISKLGNGRLERLKQVPLQRMIEISGKRFLMVHSRVTSVVDFPLLYEKKSLEEFIADYDIDVDYVLIGHTHFPLHAVHWNWKPILNPGSLGCGKDGIARFIIIEIEDEIVNITYKQLKYNKERVIHDYEKNLVPYAERFIEMFY